MTSTCPCSLVPRPYELCPMSTRCASYTRARIRPKRGLCWRRNRQVQEQAWPVCIHNSLFSCHGILSPYGLCIDLIVLILQVRVVRGIWKDEVFPGVNSNARHLTTLFRPVAQIRKSLIRRQRNDDPLHESPHDLCLGLPDL